MSNFSEKVKYALSTFWRLTHDMLRHIDVKVDSKRGLTYR